MNTENQNNTLPEIDLRICKSGQKLKTKHGTILLYVGPTEPGHYYDHIVQYPDGYNGYAKGGQGTRIHSGHVFRKNRLPEDEDIVEILPFEK